MFKHVADRWFAVDRRWCIEHQGRRQRGTCRTEELLQVGPIDSPPRHSTKPSMGAQFPGKSSHRG